MTFTVHYGELPKGLYINGDKSTQIKATVQSTGFVVVRYSLRRPNLQMSHNQLREKDSRYYLLSDQLLQPLRDHLFSRIEVRGIEPDTVWIPIEELHTKKVPVKPNVSIGFETGYQLTRPFTVEPDSVTIYGNSALLEETWYVETQATKLRKVKSSFEEEVKLITPSKATFSLHPHQVKIKGDVSKVSERVIKVSITPKNLPESSQVRLFPSEVDILCTGSISNLKELTAQQIKVIADFEQKSNDGQRVMLSITTKPEHIRAVFLKEAEVNFLIRKQ